MIQGRANSVSQVDGGTHLQLYAGGGLNKGIMTSACFSVWEDAVHQLLSLCQILQFLSVCHWCLSGCYCGAGAQR